MTSYPIPGGETGKQHNYFAAAGKGQAGPWLDWRHHQSSIKGSRDTQQEAGHLPQTNKGANEMPGAASSQAHPPGLLISSVIRGRACIPGIQSVHLLLLSPCHRGRDANRAQEEQPVLLLNQQHRASSLNIEIQKGNRIYRFRTKDYILFALSEGENINNKN